MMLVLRLPSPERSRPLLGRRRACRHSSHLRQQRCRCHLRCPTLHQPRRTRGAPQPRQQRCLEDQGRRNCMLTREHRASHTRLATSKMPTQQSLAATSELRTMPLLRRTHRFCLHQLMGTARVSGTQRRSGHQQQATAWRRRRARFGRDSTRTRSWFSVGPAKTS